MVISTPMCARYVCGIQFHGANTLRYAECARMKKQNRMTDRAKAQGDEMKRVNKNGNKNNYPHSSIFSTVNDQDSI